MIPQAAHDHTPAGTEIVGEPLNVEYERANPVFHKWHIREGSILHRFTGPDHGHWHDHPFWIDILVLAGGYKEDRLDPVTLEVTRFDRHPGDTFRIEATDIHRMAELMAPECWTLARYGPRVRREGSWIVADGKAEFHPW